MGRRCPSILGYHKGNRKWYRKIDGKFIYFGSVCEKSPESFHAAWREYQAWLAENDNPIDVFVESPVPGGRPHILLKQGHTVESVFEKGPAYVIDMLRDKIARTAEMPADRQNEYFAALLAWAVQEMSDKTTQHEIPTPRRPSFKLPRVFDFWREVRKPAKTHLNKTRRYFEKFVSIVGEVSLFDLTESMLRTYIAALEKSGMSANHRKHHFTGVKLVLNFVLTPRAKNAANYDAIKPFIPMGLTAMTKMLNVDPEELKDPDDLHTRPFPPDEFRRITAEIEKATSAEFDGDHELSPLAFKAIWLIGCQTGFNLTDFARLRWDRSLVLHDTAPHVRLPREKRGKGKRCIPLAPDTIKAVQKYRDSLTGSFNFTKAAEESNAENLLVIRDQPRLVEKYLASFRLHQKHAEPYDGGQAALTDDKPTDPPKGKFVGSKNSDVYHYPGCPAIQNINPKNLVEYDSPPSGKRLHAGCQR